jgi:hypothetical protein
MGAEDVPEVLPDEAIVVRGGIMAHDTLNENAWDHCRDVLAERGWQWGLSVFSHPSADVATICRIAWPILRHGQVRLSTVGALRASGYDVVPDGEKGHCLIPLGPPPWDDDWHALADSKEGVFGPPEKNPEKERRKAEK